MSRRLRRSRQACLRGLQQVAAGTTAQVNPFRTVLSVLRVWFFGSAGVMIKGAIGQRAEGESVALRRVDRSFSGGLGLRVKGAGFFMSLKSGIARATLAAFVVLMAQPALLATQMIAGGVTIAEAAVIKRIQVQGNRRIEPETVRSYLQFSEGDTYDADAVDASLKALYGTGLFSDVRISRSGGTVLVRLVENPVINIVAFEGNSQVDDATLRSEVQLRPRAVYSRARVQADVQRILDVYSRTGRFAARVEPKIIEISHNRVNLVFEIDEGPSTKVKAINFIGNEAFSDSELREVITTSEYWWFNFLATTDVYDPDRLNLDRELLRQFYLKSGYADVRIVSAVADLDTSGEGFFITFTIEEGEPYNYGTIDISTSISSVDTAPLWGELLTKTGDVYNAADIDKTVENLTLRVTEQGYAFARVRAKVFRDQLSRTIGITYHVEQGPRVYIERIDIYGNTRTKDKIIRREFRLAEGDAYNKLMIGQARRRLMALQFFKSVKIRTRPGSASDRVVLSIHVVEQSTGELAFSAGYSSAEGVIGEISVTERNLLGNGQYLRLKLGGSFQRLQIDMSFTEPRFLDQNLSAGFDIVHKEIDYTRQAGYKLRRSGGGLRLGFPLSERLWFSSRYNIYVDEIFDVEDTASDLVQDQAGRTVTSSIGYTLTYDTRNKRRSPTLGTYLAFSQDLAGVGGDVSYIRSTLEGRAYYPIMKKITLVGRVIAGHIEGWGGRELRLSDGFYKGGETVRGFDRAGFGPRDAVTGDAVGGKIFAGATAEVRFPLPFLPEDLGMSGALFADAGTLFDPVATSTNTINDSSGIRSSVGASLLWNSPMGPLRADFAYVLTKEEFDDTQVFRFGAATPF